MHLHICSEEHHKTEINYKFEKLSMINMTKLTSLIYKQPLKTKTQFPSITKLGKDHLKKTQMTHKCLKAFNLINNQR